MSAPTNRPIRSYDEFWPFYLQEHAKPTTRALHYAGTAVSLVCLGAAAVLREPWFLLGALFGGYGFAWVGHFFVERNRPATFTYPLWSLISDYRMTWRWATGRLGGDLVRAGLDPQNS
ncbi:MAG: DUF962 domain-containing protein [Alphaproteobacteria bacterium]|nr:DUF962 domain-containing protein [Alphaproteobacteria bacterium]